MFSKSVVFGILYFLMLPAMFSASYFLDPVNGALSNNGSLKSPLPDLQSVLEANMVESSSYLPLPYEAGVSNLVVKNQDALIGPGDTLFLMDGLHGVVDIRGYFNEQPITIMAYTDHKPILKSIRIKSGSNWHFENLTISSEPYGDYINYRLVYFETHGWHGPATDMQVRDCVIYSAEEPWTTAEDWLSMVSSGIYGSGDRMHFTNNEIRNVAFGIAIGGDFAYVAGNEIINFSRDGMRAIGSDGIYEYNIIKNCYKVDDNHDDGIQSFTTNGNVVDRNTLRGNIIINREDPNQALSGTLQGIGCFDGFYHDWVIENNLVFVDHYHGISLYGARNCTIINNTVLDPTPDETPGSIWIRIHPHKDGSPSSDNIVANNVSNRFIIDGGVEISNFVLTDHTDYQENFVDFLNNDFHLISSSVLVDSADIEWATEIDLDQVLRNNGDGPDIGAYEFQGTSTGTDQLQQNELLVFPNPVEGQLHIDYDTSWNDLMAFIYASNGQLVKSVELTDLSIDLNDLSKGNYLIVLKNQKGELFRSWVFKI